MENVKNVIIPLFYANNIGLEACFILNEIIENIKEEKENFGEIAWFWIKKKEFVCDDLKFVTEDFFKKGMEDLFNSGFVIKKRSSGRDTSKFAVNVFNIMIFDLVGPDLYFDMIREVKNNVYSGFFADSSMLLSVKEIKSPSYLSYFHNNVFVDYNNIDLDKFKMIILTIYNNDIYKINKYIDESGVIKFKYPSECQSFPKNLRSISFPCGINNINGLDKPYFEFILSGKEVSKDFLSCFNESEDKEQEEEIEIEKVEKKSVKDIARTDYVSYCKYMKVAETMKKPVKDWNATDFVIYLFCGKAKKDMEEGKELEFPNFRRHCSAMKKIVGMYGNKKMVRIIHALVSDCDKIKEQYRIKDLRVNISTLSIDWIVSSILEYIEEKDSNKEDEEADKINNRIEEVKKERILSNNREEFSGDKTEMLKKLRGIHNKEKQDAKR